MGIDERRRGDRRGRGNHRKKLAAALRYALTRRATDDWLAEVAEEEPDAGPFLVVVDEEMPEDAELTDFAAPYFAAWRVLANDRPMGAMGGAGRIPLASIRRDAARFGFDGEDAEETFARMMCALDDVYLAWLDEQQRERQEQSKRR